MEAIMNEIIYHKLVRDKIPEIIEKAGKKYSMRILSLEELKKESLLKIKEEYEELEKAQTPQEQKEELADLFEIIDAFMDAHQFSKEEIQQIREKKKEKRGGFELGLFLEKTWEEPL